jgi:tripartite-type tricarboxylate transporter receptor subunit TctC
MTSNLRAPLRRAALAVLALAGLALPLAAQGYPNAPVKLVVTTGVGAGPDVTARLVAEHLSQLWKQQVYVVNHPGAAGSLGMKVAGAATPDGYTLLFAQSSSFVTVPEVQASFPYDLLRDFVTIGFVGEQPIALAVQPGLGVDTLAQFIALAKAKPGALNIAVLSRGGIPHLAAEWLKMASGTDMTAVNYSGTPQGLSDVMGGRVQAIMDGLAGMAGNVSAGTVKLIAVGSAQRLANLPDIPTFAETLPEVKRALGWFAFMGPPGTPAPIAAKVSEDLRTVLSTAELKARFLQIGTYVRPMTQAETLAYIREEQQIWKPVLAKFAKVGK